MIGLEEPKNVIPYFESLAVSKQPRAINLVSICIYGMLAAGLYCAFQFGIPYYRNWKVTGALADTKRDAGRFIPGTGDPREAPVMEDLRRRVVDIGIEDSALDIYFGADNRTLHVNYTVVITHPIGDPTIWVFRNTESIEPVGR